MKEKPCGPKMTSPLRRLHNANYTNCEWSSNFMCIYTAGCFSCTWPHLIKPLTLFSVRTFPLFHVYAASILRLSNWGLMSTVFTFKKSDFIIMIMIIVSNWTAATVEDSKVNVLTIISVNLGHSSDVRGSSNCAIDKVHAIF